MARYFYSGDLSIEHGGYFYSFENWKWGYVDALRVTPCSDAGAQDNVYWIERLTVNIREGEALKSVLQCCGLESPPKGAARRHALVDCHIAYGAYDAESVAVLQVGPAEPLPRSWNDPVRPTHKVRAGRDLKKLARKLAHGYSVLALGAKHV